MPNEKDFAKVRAYYQCSEQPQINDRDRIQQLEFLVMSLTREVDLLKKQIGTFIHRYIHILKLLPSYLYFPLGFPESTSNIDGIKGDC